MKSLRSLIVAATLAATASFALPALADGVAVVNIQEIMHSSTAAKSVKEQLDAKRKSFQTEMSRKEAELQKEDQALGQQRSLLSPEAFDKKLKEFKAKANGAQKEVQTKGGELDSAVSASLNQIQKAIGEIVDDLAKQRGYTLVETTSQLLYADPKLDITQDVLTRLNKKLPKVSVFKSTAAHDDE